MPANREAGCLVSGPLPAARTLWPAAEPGARRGWFALVGRRSILSATLSPDRMLGVPGAGRHRGVEERDA